MGEVSSERAFLKGCRRLGLVRKGQKELFSQRKGTVSSKARGSPGLGARL